MGALRLEDLPHYTYDDYKVSFDFNNIFNG